MKKQVSACLLCFSATITNVALADSMKEAESIYKDVCAVCHGITGKGELPGVPDFTLPNGRLSKSDEVLTDSILDGFKSEGSPMAMPPKGGMPNMSHSQAKDMVKYLKSIF
ncbi:MAG: cytochrome c [Motiliproteus sp.]|nr:cytochrome c [Motiliproteus sp.]MCW9051607.1 cytochrome c [Motiliproteus sp.]